MAPGVVALPSLRSPPLECSCTISQLFPDAMPHNLGSHLSLSRPSLPLHPHLPHPPESWKTKGEEPMERTGSSLSYTASERSRARDSCLPTSSKLESTMLRSRCERRRRRKAHLQSPLPERPATRRRRPRRRWRMAGPCSRRRTIGVGLGKRKRRSEEKESHQLALIPNHTRLMYLPSPHPLPTTAQSDCAQNDHNHSPTTTRPRAQT